MDVQRAWEQGISYYADLFKIKEKIEPIEKTLHSLLTKGLSEEEKSLFYHFGGVSVLSRGYVLAEEAIAEFKIQVKRIWPESLMLHLPNPPDFIFVLGELKVVLPNGEVFVSQRGTKR